MAKILDGRKLAEEILNKLKKETKDRHLKLRLTVILVGNGQISRIFIHGIEKDSQIAGVDFKLYKFPAKIISQKLKKEIEKIVKNPQNSGIIIQLPLPQKFLSEEFLNLIPEQKDVNVLSEKSLGKFYQGTLKILPPTVGGILKLFKNYRIKLKGKDIVVVGVGRLVGFPLATQLLKEKATVSILNEFTKDGMDTQQIKDLFERIEYSGVCENKR